MVRVRPPLAKVALASAIVYLITATVEMTAPAHLSTREVAWLVKPWLGAWTYTFPLSPPSTAAMLVGIACLFVVSVAFYLNHCVIDQPAWAVFGGWGPMVSGLTMNTLQSAFGAWWVSVDINHSGFPLAYCELVVGAGIVGISWVAAPQLFNPRLGRPWVVGIIVGILGLTFLQSALNAPAVLVDLAVMVLLVAGLFAGERIESSRVEFEDDRPPAVPIDGEPAGPLGTPD